MLKFRWHHKDRSKITIFKEHRLFSPAGNCVRPFAVGPVAERGGVFAHELELPVNALVRSGGPSAVYI